MTFKRKRILSDMERIKSFLKQNKKDIVYKGVIMDV